MADRGRNENVPNLLHRADFRNGKSHGPPQSGAFACLISLTFFVLETQGLRTFLQTDDDTRHNYSDQKNILYGWLNKCLSAFYYSKVWWSCAIESCPRGFLVSKSVAVSSLLKVMIKGVDPRGDGDSCPTKKWSGGNPNFDVPQSCCLLCAFMHMINRDRQTERAWFSCLLRHLARKWSGSILTTPEPAWSRYPW